MKILICCNKHFYTKIPVIKNYLEGQGHTIILPNSFEDPFSEDVMKEKPKEEYEKWKKSMFEESQHKIKEIDAVLVLNFEKNGISNYIGGATFLEIYDAFKEGKKIFFHNPVPEGMLYDELNGFSPTIIKGDLSKIVDKKIEVEIQSFITKEQYENLLNFFRQNAEFVKEDYQETFYFDENSNLRIQRTNKDAKLWHKSGNVHDEFMEEIEIRTSRDDFEKAEKFLNKLGHNVKIKWFRTRNKFLWQGFNVSIDFTKSYGYMLEIDKLVAESEKEHTLEEIKNKFRELNIEITSKEEFTRKYNYYKENWRDLINDLD